MKHAQRCIRLCVACYALTVGATAQTRPRATAPRATPPPSTAAAQPQTEANEDFELNIDQKRITEHDFFASTSIMAGEEQAKGLRLFVGVAVGAQEIDVLLRNVRGHVRFRASLDPLLRVIDARRGAPPSAGSPVP